MLSSTPEYFCFLVLVFFAYWLAHSLPRGRSRMAGLAVACGANLLFLGRWGWIYLLIVPLASTSDFFIGRGLARYEESLTRRTLLALSLCLNVGLIVSCKYVPLFLDTWAVWFSRPAPAFANSWVLPLSLSFYAFQSMTYTMDVYRHDAKPTTEYLDYLASACFFPTVLAGPITRIAALLQQWAKTDRVLTSEEGSRALFLIGLGLFKKFLIADYLSTNLINRVFDLPTLYSGGDVLVAVYAFAFQLYYDFSAYTDIAIGSALLIGIRLPINFNFPYKAESIADFWRRWHISLSNWLRDYLYFSLPGQRKRIWPYINLIVTMAIGGFWHGANWTFLVWGLLHGLGLAVFRLWQALRGHKRPSAFWAARAGRIVLTFHYVLFTWVFFRAGSMEAALQILAQIASFRYSFDNTSGPFLMVLAIAVAAHSTPRKWYDSAVSLFGRAPAFVQGVALVLLVVAIQYVATTGAAPFIYTKF